MNALEASPSSTLRLHRFFLVKIYINKKEVCLLLSFLFLVQQITSWDVLQIWQLYFVFILSSVTGSL